MAVRPPMGFERLVRPDLEDRFELADEYLYAEAVEHIAITVGTWPNRIEMAKLREALGRLNAASFLEGSWKRPYDALSAVFRAVFPSRGRFGQCGYGNVQVDDRAWCPGMMAAYELGSKAATRLVRTAIPLQNRLFKEGRQENPLEPLWPETRAFVKECNNMGLTLQCLTAQLPVYGVLVAILIRNYIRIKLEDPISVHQAGCHA